MSTESRAVPRSACETSLGGTGYCHRRYAESFAEFGAPRELPLCGGWIIERTVPGSDLPDAMGCYPLFACRDWSRLHADLADLAGKLVSLTLVTDPFGDFSADLLSRCFDRVVPYKQHYVTDLSRPPTDFLRRRHRRNVAKALEQLELQTCEDPSAYLDEWVDLYAQLASRHGIRGLRAFSPRSFALQLSTPGLVMFKATAGGRLAGLHLWYVQGDVAYGHLGATNDLGYRCMASYALYWHAIDQLRHRVRWLELGAAAGVSPQGPGSGLDDFKAGWATDTREVYLCGRILEPRRYEQLSRGQGVESTSYFPVYRAGEFSAAGTAAP